jgi:OOP family OmpA-OmpF porin
MPEPVDYERIENIVKKYIPREVVKEVVVGEKEKKPTYGYNAEEDKWVLVGVNFGFNSAKLQQEAYPVLFHAAVVLLQNPQLEVEIQGYTDNIGSAEYNKRLSQKRAQVVKDYLVARGVSASRLTAVGYGEKMPIADNKTAEGRAMNRRIEFKVK